MYTFQTNHKVSQMYLMDGLNANCWCHVGLSLEQQQQFLDKYKVISTGGNRQSHEQLSLSYYTILYIQYRTRVLC